jgi:hypothetical protein
MNTNIQASTLELEEGTQSGEGQIEATERGYTVRQFVFLSLD